MPESLIPLFRPRSVAVIGASRTENSIGYIILDNLIKFGFTGPIYPVNLEATSIHSVKAYRSVLEIPDPVDLAVVVVPSRFVLDVVDQCGRKGVRGIIVISAGFKEVGPEGAKAEAVLREKVRSCGMRMVGPNCLGLLSAEPAVRLNATFAPCSPPHGRVAFSSQSGALGLAILDYARQLNIGMSHFVSTGNKADVSGNDLLEFWETDEGTDVILLYLESFGNTRRFSRIARRVSRQKPIVAVKSGRTTSGRRAALSHTGSLASSDTAADALFKTTGVVRVETIEELFDVAMLLANQPLPQGNRVCIITNAGGPGILAADACESHGLILPELCEQTAATVRSILPAEASVRNPIDMIASANPLRYRIVLEAVLEDPNVDAVIVIFVPPQVTLVTDVANAIVSASCMASKPVLSCYMGSRGINPALAALQKHHVPSYAFPEAASLALARVVQYSSWRRRPRGLEPVFDGVDTAGARALVEKAVAEGRKLLTWEETASLLAAYGVRVTAAEFAPTREETVALAERIGFPVVLKVVAEGLTHKSDVGGIRLDLETREKVLSAFESIRESLAAKAPELRMKGAIVQKMEKDGVEVIVGAMRDRSFGHMVMFGLGGIMVEVLKDVSFMIAPLTDADAAEMVRSVKSYPLLTGFRGGPSADVSAVEDAILRISRLVTDVPQIAEMDLNPIKVMQPGKGCIVVDARVRVGE